MDQGRGFKRRRRNNFHIVYILSSRSGYINHDDRKNVNFADPNMRTKVLSFFTVQVNVDLEIVSYQSNEQKL